MKGDNIGDVLSIALIFTLPLINVDVINKYYYYY